MTEDENAHVRSPTLTLGMDLDALSLADLDLFKARLSAEMDRIDAAIKAKRQSRGQADALFRL